MAEKKKKGATKQNKNKRIKTDSNQNTNQKNTKRNKPPHLLTGFPREPGGPTRPRGPGSPLK